MSTRLRLDQGWVATGVDPQGCDRFIVGNQHFLNPVFCIITSCVFVGSLVSYLLPACNSHEEANRVTFLAHSPTYGLASTCTAHSRTTGRGSSHPGLRCS